MEILFFGIYMAFWFSITILISLLLSNLIKFESFVFYSQVIGSFIAVPITYFLMNLVFSKLGLHENPGIKEIANMLPYVISIQLFIEVVLYLVFVIPNPKERIYLKIELENGFYNVQVVECKKYKIREGFKEDLISTIDLHQLIDVIDSCESRYSNKHFVRISIPKNYDENETNNFYYSKDLKDQKLSSLFLENYIDEKEIEIHIFTLEKKV